MELEEGRKSKKYRFTEIDNLLPDRTSRPLTGIKLDEPLFLEISKQVGQYSEIVVIYCKIFSVVL